MIPKLILSKETKKKFINTLVNKCKQSKLSNKSLGILFRCFHLNAPFFILSVVCTAPKIEATFAAIGLLIAALLFTLFKGCFLSMLEQKLCKDNFNIIDPLLEFCDIQINSKNRYIGTYYVISLYFPIFFFIYYYRFCKNYN